MLQLRYHRRLTNDDIAASIGCTRRTVERDLNWWREQWHRVYGTENPIFDPVAKIGETIALYEQIEERALQELQSLEADPLEPAIAALRALTAKPETSENDRYQALQLMGHALEEQSKLRRAGYMRMRCLKVAQEARQQQINFLQDLGLLDRNLGTLDLSNVQNPEAFARWLAKAREVPSDSLVSEAERQMQKGRVH